MLFSVSCALFSNKCSYFRFPDGSVDAYKSIFLTPAGENYYLMEDYGQSIGGKTSFMFQVQACSNVHILLMQDRHDFEEKVYEIRIGTNMSNSCIFIYLFIYLFTYLFIY